MYEISIFNFHFLLFATFVMQRQLLYIINHFYCILCQKKLKATLKNKNVTWSSKLSRPHLFDLEWLRAHHTLRTTTHSPNFNDYSKLSKSNYTSNNDKKQLQCRRKRLLLTSSFFFFIVAIL